MVCAIDCAVLGCPVVSDSLWPHGLRQAPLSMGTLQARILEWVSIQGIFPTQGSNPSLLHFRQILYQLSLCKRLNIQFKGKELRKVKGKGESLRESCIPDQPVFTEGWQGGGPTIQRTDSVIVKWQTSLTSQQERDFRFWQPLLRPSNHPSEAPGCPTWTWPSQLPAIRIHTGLRRGRSCDWPGESRVLVKPGSANDQGQVWTCSSQTYVLSLRELDRETHRAGWAALRSSEDPSGFKTAMPSWPDWISS